MNVRAVLFDRDGTLIDLHKTWGAVLQHVLLDLAGGDEMVAIELGALVLFDYKRCACEPGSPIMTSPPSGYSEPWATHLGVDYNSAFLERIESLLLARATQCVSVFEDTTSSIKALADAGVPIGLATNGTEASAIAQLKHLGIFDYFTFVVGYDSGHGEKPDPGQLFGFAQHTGIEPHDIAMVGDSLHDMHAAKNAGMLRVAVTTGAQTAEELQDHCDHLLDSLTELVNLMGLSPAGEGAAA
ncbi:phosphatase [Pseudovibrio japonicus]|uniref:phosphoglycolate phosphatase n=1 Tax=Pseudovibrio japonicus TaxID=366534 RepID=A0ABQ3E0S4_9HYPH|nr:HAD family hydrolase [Pseudovibrio japonicus]GHB21172.1 phosphatase [Pseudovibrio japonicus]